MLRLLVSLAQSSLWGFLARETPPPPALCSGRARPQERSASMRGVTSVPPARRERVPTSVREADKQ